MPDNKKNATASKTPSATAAAKAPPTTAAAKTPTAAAAAKVPPAAKKTAKKTPATPAITAVARTPLGERAAIVTDAYRQEERPALGKLIIRGDGSAPFAAAIKTALGLKLPTVPKTVTAPKSQQDELLWLGPTEWLLWTDAPQERAAALQSALAAQHAAVVDVSAYYTIIRIGGAQADLVLAHGCPLDLRPQHFAAGACAQTHFRNAGILLRRTADGWDVQVRWSFADYLWDYFLQTAKLLP